MEPLFHAITGEEFKEILLKDLRKALEDSGQFLPHITFPLVKWKFKLECIVVPRQAIDAEPELVVEGGEALIYGLKKDDKDPKTIVITHEELIDTPDQARQDRGLPIPTPVRGPDGSLEDAMVKSAKPESQETRVKVEIDPEPAIVVPAPPVDPPSLAKPAPESVLAEAQVAPSGPKRGEVARSAIVATRANPDGVRVGRKGKE